MREFKFRAWFPLTNFMDYSPILIYVNNHLEPRILQDGYFKPIAIPYVVMQYTGLKDKNGKEIYEGDIINHIHGTKERVFYDRGKFNVTSRVDSILLYYVLDNLEIIGNIYENPELFEGVNKLQNIDHKSTT